MVTSVSGFITSSPLLAMTQGFASKAPPWLDVGAASERLLVAAANTWEDTSTSEQYIQKALAPPDVEFDVLVGAYRYYFYKNRDVEALQVARTVLDRIHQAEQWPTDWDTLMPILKSRLEDTIVRLYLNAYAGSGLLLARLGRVQEAETIAAQVQQIDAKEFGADVLITVLNPPPDEEDEEGDTL